MVLRWPHTQRQLPIHVAAFICSDARMSERVCESFGGREKIVRRWERRDVFRDIVPV